MRLFRRIAADEATDNLVEKQNLVLSLIDMSGLGATAYCGNTLILLLWSSLSYDFSAKKQWKNLKKIVTSSYGKEWATYL
jgi:hypothetical protein